MVVTETFIVCLNEFSLLGNPVCFVKSLTNKNPNTRQNVHDEKVDKTEEKEAFVSRADLEYLVKVGSKAPAVFEKTQHLGETHNSQKLRYFADSCQSSKIDELF